MNRRFIRRIPAVAAALALVALSFASVAAAQHGEAPAAHAPAAGHAAPATGTGHGDTHGAKAGELAGEDHALAPINWTDTGNKKQPPFLAMAINFAVLLGIYYYFGRKPVAEALKKRRENIAKQIEEADRIKTEALARAEKYQAQLGSLDIEAEQTKKAIRATGEADRERVLREADEKAARLEREAEALLDAERKQAKRDLYEEAVEAAVVKAEALLRAKLTQADHDRLAEDFLAQLAARQAPGTRGSAGGSVTGAGAGAAPMDKRGES